VHAAPAPLHEVRAYAVIWNSLHIGDIIAEVKETNGTYHFETHMRSREIIKLLAPYTNRATATIKPSSTRGFIPVSYENTVKLRKKLRTIRMHYAADSTLNTLIVTPEDSIAKRPPATPAQLIGSIDPLTGTMLAQHYVKNYLATGHNKDFTFNIYDGRKLFAVHFTIIGKSVITLDNNPVATVHFRFSRKAIAGFTAKELAKMPKEEPVIDVYLRDDATLLPVKAVGKAASGSVTAVLTKSCATLEACMEK
jgi:hypothetical protein